MSVAPNRLASSSRFAWMSMTTILDGKLVLVYECAFREAAQPEVLEQASPIAA